MSRPIYIIDDIIGGLVMYQPATDRGSFVDTVLMAWQRADPDNKRLMQDYIDEIIDKYRLDQIWDKIKKKDPAAQRLSDDWMAEHEIV